MSISRLYKETFFTNSFWKCPAGVKFITLTGCGGGGGGGGGAVSGANYSRGSSGAGGEPSLTISEVTTVNPGTIYTITIGAGGVGGTIGVSSLSSGLSGGKGGSSYFDGHEFVGGDGGLGGIPINNGFDAFFKDYLFISRNGINGRSSGGDFFLFIIPGGSGGTSNNIYSYGGYVGGDGGDGGVGGGGAGAAQPFLSLNFKGGNGGSGFIEIAWTQ